MLYYVPMATAGSIIGVALAHWVSSMTARKALEGDHKRIEPVRLAHGEQLFRRLSVIVEPGEHVHNHGNRPRSWWTL